MIDCKTSLSGSYFYKNEINIKICTTNCKNYIKNFNSLECTPWCSNENYLDGNDCAIECPVNLGRGFYYSKDNKKISTSCALDEGYYKKENNECFDSCQAIMSWNR